jgi:hypothetical protein
MRKQTVAAAAHAVMLKLRMTDIASEPNRARDAAATEPAQVIMARREPSRTAPVRR